MELGQVGVVVVVGAVQRVASRLSLSSDALLRVLIYAMGSVAAFWAIERLPAVLAG